MSSRVFLTAPGPRLWTQVSLATFYCGFAMVYLPAFGLPGAGAAVVALGLFVGILAAPLEYALGATACTFVLACCIGLSSAFLNLRWLFLGVSLAVLSLRFFLARKVGHTSIASKFVYLIAVFLIVSSATLVTSVATELTLLKLAALACLLYVAWRAAPDLVDTHGPSSAHRLALGLLAYPMAPIVLSFASYLLGFGQTYGSTTFGGYLENANAYGSLVAMALPWLAAGLFRGSRQPRSWRLGLYVAAVMFFYGLLLTGSRSALLGTLLAVTLFCMIHANRRVTALLLLFAVFVATRVLATPDLLSEVTGRYLYKHKIRGQDKPQTDPLQSRVRPWRIARESFFESPWLGLGFGVTSKAESNWSIDVRTGPGAIETGSSVLGSLVQVGILGAGPLFLAIVLLLIEAGRFAWRVKDPWLTGIYGSTVALTVCALFEGFLIAPGSFPTMYFWVQCFFLNRVICQFRPSAVRQAACLPSTLARQPL